MTLTDQVNRKIEQLSDGLGRLVTVNEQDSSGNLTQATSYSYDVSGVTTAPTVTYTYDSENRIVAVDTTAASYGYDHQNRRYKKTVGSTVTHYVWEGGKVLSEHNGSTGAVLVNYIGGGSRMVAKIAGGTTSYFLSDRLSVRLTLDTSGAVVGRQAHLPFGEDFAPSGTPDKHHFTSYENDSETGTNYAVNRQHAAAVGRFMQADPYRASGGPPNPQSWNRYAYAGNEPVNFGDPSGLSRVYFVNPCWFVVNETGCSASYMSMNIPDPGESDAEGGVGRIIKAMLPTEDDEALKSAAVALAALLKGGFLDNGDCKAKVLDPLRAAGVDITKFAGFLDGAEFYDGPKSNVLITDGTSASTCMTAKCKHIHDGNIDGKLSWRMMR